jgi:hypothetical protein
MPVREIGTHMLKLHRAHPGLLGRGAMIAVTQAAYDLEKEPAETMPTIADPENASDGFTKVQAEPYLALNDSKNGNDWSPSGVLKDIKTVAPGDDWRAVQFKD